METLAKTYTVKPQLVSCPPTTRVNPLPQQQASYRNQFFLTLRRLVMNIKVWLVYLRLMVQQLANLQTSFQQQIAAPGTALGASTNINSSTMNFDISFDLHVFRIQ